MNAVRQVVDVGQTNVNDLIRPFGIQFGSESPDSQSGGHTNAGLITDKRLKISYHGARTVTGGTPFCFNDRSDVHPFGTFMQVKNGGRIIVMGDGMVSLYMTGWEGVQDYQCQKFMQAAFPRHLILTRAYRSGTVCRSIAAFSARTIPKGDRRPAR
jgi:hypothetical protein